MRHYICNCLLWLAVLIAHPIYAQEESSDVRHGNRQYRKEEYNQAEVDYRRALGKNEDSFEAHYNLGNSLFKQEKYPEAQEQFETARKLINEKEDTKKAADIDHNLGNCYFAQQQYDKAVEAYQSSLRNNPKDHDTRYNLVKAMQMLQQQQNQQQQQQQQEQEQEKNEKQEQQQQQQNQQQQQQQQEQQMDKETAEQILEALEQDERETQEKMQRQKGSKKRVEKDW